MCKHMKATEYLLYFPHTVQNVSMLVQRLQCLAHITIHQYPYSYLRHSPQDKVIDGEAAHLDTALLKQIIFH